jgi:ubiquinone/menaquinone biosynthesis C-methylase UbiE
MDDDEKTKKTYDKFAKEYHEHRTKTKNNFYYKYLEKPTLLKLLKPISKNKKILDLGCGSGLFTKELINLGGKCIGIDLSKELISLAKRFVPEAKFYVGKAQKMPFKKNSFEIVASNEVIHYFKDLDPVFSEVSRVLKKNGIFIFLIKHPLVGILKKIKIDGKNQRIIYSYFGNEFFKWEMLDGMEIKMYRQTFEKLAVALNNSGFYIDIILEPHPSKKAKNFNPEAYEKTSKYPSLTVIKAVKK